MIFMIIIYMSLGHIDNYHITIIKLESETSTIPIRLVLNLKLEIISYCMI
jgi:hypothetical protein